MPPTTPLLLLDNVFDTSVLYLGATLSASDAQTGHEAFRVADYRRERTWWQPASDAGVLGYHSVVVQLPTARAVDYLVLDRGHNLAGLTIYLESSNDGASWVADGTFVELTVPASGTIGGTPTAPAMANTEEGVTWTLFTALPAALWWRILIPASTGFLPIVPGVMAGLRTQLLGHSSVYDEDAGGRTQTTQQSTAGYLASDTTYAWRTAVLDLKLIGATEYDATMRMLRALLFAKNQPAMLFMDYATYPERGWLYRYDGASWGMAKSRVYRGGRIPLRELYPVLG
ncbi:MAG TPA: hypothetical protein VHB25_08595 [Gemmatimonadaceae bacterium]|nr:hypothetical protein [Gemmatimonadaceae bacterium]